ncbi:MAG: PAS domain S-box protein [Steroidobacteraceae bacterium]|jgi:PAS domain S-box-containing protein
MDASIGPQWPPQSDLPIGRSWTEILELLPDAAFIVDGANGGTIRYVNSQAGQMFGYESRELVDQSIDLLVPTSVKLRHEQLRSDYSQAPTRRPMGASLNLQGRRRDGTEFPVEISLSPVGSGENPQVICAIRDVTDRRKLEEALHQVTQQLERRAASSDATARQSQQYLRLFVEHAPAAVAMLDRDLRYVVASRRWLEDYGAVGRSIVGHTHYEIFPELPDRWKEAHRRALTGELLHSEEDSFVRADGRLEWIRWEILPWHIEDCEVGGIMVFTEIITRRKLAEQARLKSVEELEERVADRTRELESAKNEAARANEVKSRFLAAASHDLRQPLQTIWSLQAVLARALKDNEVAPHLSLLEEAVRNMDHMLSSLIDINRLEKGAIHPVIRDFPLREILPRLRSEFGYAARAKSLGLDIEDSAECARSDAMLLPVILRNLIGNAIKYTQHGTVRLRVRAQGTELFIDIIDSGPGIAPEHLRRLFDAFYQVDNPNQDQRKGFGLGLSIVETICRLLGHEASIQSRLGEGSTFTVQIQRGVRTDLPPEPASITTATSNIPSSGAKILHIEDDPGIARSMALLLGLEGYFVVGAASRDEALEHINVQRFRPDLILSDYQLPMGYTGVEIVAEIAALLGYKPPTIMLTGDIADRHVGDAKMIADRIMSKPVDVNRLLREMETLLGKPD